MVKDNHRFQYLFSRYTTKNVSESEKKEFLEMAADKHYRHLLKKLIRNEVENNQADREVTSTKADEMFEKIMEVNHLSQKKVVYRSSNRIHLKWLAAAVILFMLIMGSYLFLTGSRDKQLAKKNYPAQTILKNDVAPGHSGAILTLSNGQQIILDSADNGILTTQGNTDIMKTGTQLSYTGKNVSTDKILYNTMTTPKGRKFQLVLSDGSEVWLNAASSITYPTGFSKNERKVEITGEAYFEIKPLYNAANEKIPFTVVIHSQTGEKREVQVLGTHFNINAYDNESTVKTTLLEGSIKMIDNTETIMIQPGEQAVIDKRAGKMSVINKADTEQAVAWKNGYFSFKNANIETIMRQVERWYDVNVVYNNGVPSGHYAGEVPMNVNASEMLKVLEVSGIHFKIENKMILIM